MSNSKLRVVVSLDAETQSYRPVAHNLSVDQAVEHVQKLQAEGTTAAIVVQEQSHRSTNVSKCKHCKQAAVDFGERLNQALTGTGRAEDEPAQASEDEETEEE